MPQQGTKFSVARFGVHPGCLAGLLAWASEDPGTCIHVCILCTSILCTYLCAQMHVCTVPLCNVHTAICALVYIYACVWVCVRVSWYTMCSVHIVHAPCICVVCLHLYVYCCVHEYIHSGCVWVHMYTYPGAHVCISTHICTCGQGFSYTASAHLPRIKILVTSPLKFTISNHLIIKDK